MSFWENFWDIFWWFFIVYAFFAFLYALFIVIADVFRDNDLSGWWKAVWIIFLAFVPFLTLLVYMMARGKGMAERSMATGPAGPGRSRFLYPQCRQREPHRGDRQSQGPPGRGNHHS